MSPARKGRGGGAGDLLAALALLALPWLLYGQALDLWWTEDDYSQIRYTAEHGPAGYTFDPEVKAKLPNRVLTPLLFASYDLDLALVGLDPAAFYAHQLAALGLAALALYGLLRLWFRPRWAVLGGGLFLLGPPVASLAPLLMVRHYPESLALALAAAALYVLAVRAGLRGQEGWAWGLTSASTLCLLAAALAKEIALPLPAVLAFLPVGSAGRRIRLLVPHAVGLAGYLLYRAWMLGTPGGGLHWVISPAERVRLALSLPGNVARDLAGAEAGAGPWGALVLVVLAGCVLYLATREQRAAGLIVAALVAALLPVLPVASVMAPRYATAAWLALAAALPAAGRALTAAGGRRRSAGMALALALLFATALAANREAWGHYHGVAERRSIESRGLLDLGAGELLRQPLGTPASLADLGTFARVMLGRQVEAEWFQDDLFLCRPGSEDGPGGRVWAYDAERRALVEIAGGPGDFRRRFCGAIRPRAALWAHFRRAGEVLHWELGPYPVDRADPAAAVDLTADGGGSGGEYAFLLGDGRARYPVPRTGAFRVKSLDLRGLRVSYRSPAGWATYSPPLAFGRIQPGSTETELAWERGAPAGRRPTVGAPDR